MFYKNVTMCMRLLLAGKSFMGFFFIQCKEEYISTQLVAWFTKFYQPSKTFQIFGTKEYCQTQKYKLETKLHPIKKRLF